MNKAILMGNVGQEPKIFAGKSGDVVSFSVATTEKGKAGESTTWHHVVCFGKTAEIAAKFVAKGNQVLLEGKISTNSYTDKAGVKQTKQQIICDRLHLLGPRQPLPAPILPKAKNLDPEDIPTVDDLEDIPW